MIRKVMEKLFEKSNTSNIFVSNFRITSKNINDHREL